MRDDKQPPICPVAIKQEPRDSADADTGDDNYTSNSYNNHTRHSAVDLRAKTTPSRGGDAGLRATVPEVTTDARNDDVSPRMLGKTRGRIGGKEFDLLPAPNSFAASIPGLSSESLADDLKNHIMNLAAASRDASVAGKASWRDVVQSGANSTCTDCGACFESSRAYRAHRLTHHVLLPERSGAEERGGAGAENSSTYDAAEAGQGSGFTGLGLAPDGSGFMCEECKAHFTSRDTYAMHMLLRAKNEACFPSRGGTTTITNPSTDSSNSRSLPSLTSASSSSMALTSAVPLLGKRSPKELKHEPRAELSRSDGLLIEAAGRHRLSGSPKALGTELLNDVARAADYSTAWWSKYMPWVSMGMGGSAGAGLVGGEAEGVGPPLPLVCYICGEIFSSRDSLAMHVLFHTRDMPTSLPDTQPAWHKPLTSSAMLVMGQAAVRQFQHATSYNSHNVVTGGFNHRQQQLSPTAAVVATAAAAAAAAVTRKTPSSLTSAGSSLTKQDTASPDSKPDMNVTQDVDDEAQSKTQNSDLIHDSQQKAKWSSDSESPGSNRLPNKTSVTDRNSLYTLPRGNSAPAPTTLTSHNTDSKSSLSKFEDLGAKCDEKPRPMSADHVNFDNRLLHRFSRGPESGVGRVPTPRGDLNEEPTGNSVGSRSGSDSQLQRNSTSATNVYRLQRLKRLRMGKNPYRRPAARGRPPMTIYGSVGRRGSGQHLPQSAPSHTSAFSQTVSPVPVRAKSVPHPASTPTLPAIPTPTPNPTTSGARKMAAMLQLLTSHGHEVSACVHCEVVFADRTLFQLHMGLHNVNNPWQCNACGLVCSSRLHFATHALHY